MKPRMWGLLTALFFLQACEFGSAPTGGGTGGEGLTGILVDSQGAGVVGAKVRVFPDGALAKRAGATAAAADSATTGVGGEFRFEGLADGHYNLTASYTRHDSLFTLFIGDVDFKGALDLGTRTMLPVATLWVYVNGEPGVPLAGATCEIPGSPWHAVSDSLGNCVLEGIAAGVYSVRVSEGGRSVVAGDVEVVAGLSSTGCQVTFEDEAPTVANWMSVSAQGYAFDIPPELVLVEQGGVGTGWTARYESPGLVLTVRNSTMLDLLVVSGYPEYRQDAVLDSSIHTSVESWKEPEPAEGYAYGARVDAPEWLFQIRARAAVDRETAVRILRSLRVVVP